MHSKNLIQLSKEIYTEHACSNFAGNSDYKSFPSIYCNSTVKNECSSSSPCGGREGGGPPLFGLDRYMYVKREGRQKVDQNSN